MFWGEAITTAVYLRTVMKNSNNLYKTPQELFTGKKPCVKHLKVYGCLAFYKVNEPNLSKLQPKSRREILLSYSQSRRVYRIYDPEKKKVHETRNVTFDESQKGWKAEQIKKKEDYTLLEVPWNEQEESNDCKDFRGFEGEADSHEDPELISDPKIDAQDIERKEECPTKTWKILITVRDFVQKTVVEEPKTYETS